MDKKKDEVDYAAAYRQFMNFGHGRSLKQFCEDEDYDYGKLLMREDEIWPNNQMKLRQITKRDTANCHIKNQPTVTSVIGQLPH